MQVLHLLSVDRDLGVLVIVLARMRDKTILFGAIWGVVVVAFSCGFQGSDLKTDGGVESELHSAGRASGWESWWIIKTYMLSFGVSFLDEIQTDESMILIFLMWPVNLLLVNLLIALLNDSYAGVKQQARLQWMIQVRPSSPLLS